METIEAVYLGRRISSDDKLIDCWIALDTLATIPFGAWMQLEEISSLFSPPKRGYKAEPGIVGGVYNLDVEMEGSRIKRCVNSSRKFQRLYHEKHAVTSFQERDSAQYQLWKKAKSLKKLEQDDSLMREIGRLKYIYKSLHPAERMAFKLALLEKLER